MPLVLLPEGRAAISRQRSFPPTSSQFLFKGRCWKFYPALGSCCWLPPGALIGSGSLSGDLRWGQGRRRWSSPGRVAPYVANVYRSLRRARPGQLPAAPKSSAPKRKQRSNACASASALLQFLRLEQLPLGPKPVLLVAAGLLRLGDQVCPFGDPLPRNRLTRGTAVCADFVPLCGPLLRPLLRGWDCLPLLSNDRANLGATVARCSCNPSLRYPGGRSA